MAAKTTTQGFGRLLTRIPKLLAPFTLFAVIGILIPAVTLVYVNPLTAEFSRHLHEMEEHTDPCSAEHIRLLQEATHDARRLLVISFAVALVTLALAFTKQIVACFFVGSSSTNSGSDDRYSLAELLREVTKWSNIKPSLVGTTVVTFAIVAVVQVAPMALLGVNFVTVMRDYWFLSVRGSLFLAASLAFLYLGIMALTTAAVSRLEWSVLVLTTLLLPALLIPVCAFAVLYLYTEQVMGLGPSLLSVHDLLQGVQHLLYLSAANVYYYYYQAGAMEESKEKVVACNEEKKI